MAIRIASSDLRITALPRLAPVTVAGNVVTFELNQQVEAVGSVTFDGAPGDLGTGWSLGFIQAQWVETNWGVYRGATQADGSAFVQRARPPARPQQACLDNVVAADPYYGSQYGADARVPVGGTAIVPFTATLPARPTFPLTLEVLHSDMPSDEFDYERPNRRTGQPNYLREAQLEFAFCAVLAVRDPVGGLHQLRGFYWNVGWQSQFQDLPAGVGERAVPGGNACNVGRIFTGAPNDPRFRSVLARPQPTTCTIMFRSATQNPNVKEAEGWPVFDVRR